MKNRPELEKQIKNQPLQSKDWELERTLSDTPSEAVSDTGRRNQSNIQAWLPVWFRNYRENIPTILSDYKLGDRNASTSPLSSRAKRTDVAICCASGPSLNLIKPYIQNWEGLLICGPTNAGLPSAHGRWPDFVVAVDANIETVIPIKRVRWDKEVNFIIPPLIDPNVAEACGDQRYWYMSRIQGDPKDPGNHPFNHYTQYLFGDLLKSYMLQAGCVGNQTIILCQMFKAVKRFNIKKIFLVGFDFAYTGGIYKCDSYKQPANRNYEWTEHKPGPIRTRANMRLSEKGLLTDRSMLGYKRSLYTMWYSLNCGSDSDGLVLYNLSTGILDDIPRPYGAEPLEQQIEKTIRTHGENTIPYGKTYIKDAFSNYLDRTRTPEEQEQLLEDLVGESLLDDWQSRLESNNIGWDYSHVIETKEL